ncbi:MAG: FAD-binding protein [Acidimicrobiales bacterium]
MPCPNYPDYCLDLPGASTGGRSLDAAPLSLAGLGRTQDCVLRPPGYQPLTHEEWERWRQPARYDREVLKARSAAGIHTSGVALVGGLLLGVLAAGGRVARGCAVVEARPAERGYLVKVSRRDGYEAVVAQALVLATGGFDRDPELRDRYLPAHLVASGSSPGNRGDGLRIALELGGTTENLGEGWWMPMLSLPEETVEGEVAYRSLVRERALPRQIMVGRHGRRFANEAAPYHQLTRELLEEGADGRSAHQPCYLIFDHGFRSRYSLPGVARDGPPGPSVTSAATIGELGARLWLDREELEATVGRWNEACAEGVDRDHGRGRSAFDRYGGDRDLATPNLGPLDRPPYYAVRVLPGTIGSKGGPVTDASGCVVDRGGKPIDGLYAVGNAAAFWTGSGYPGPGATLGAGMTFGYLSGRAAAGLVNPDR